MSDYTPTTDEVYAAIADAAPGWGLSELDDADALTRWLAVHDREVAAKALRDASTGTLAWIVKPTPDGEWTSVASWLRTRADRIEKGE